MIKLLWDELKEVSQKVSLKKTRKAIYFLTRILNQLPCPHRRYFPMRISWQQNKGGLGLDCADQRKSSS